MGWYAGPTETLTAGDVATGDRLVDGTADDGFLTVIRVAADGGTVYLEFDNGEDVTYTPREVLHRVHRSAEAAR